MMMNWSVWGMLVDVVVVKRWAFVFEMWCGFSSLRGRRGGRSRGDAIDQVLEGSKLATVHQIKLCQKHVKVLEAGVEVGFLSEAHDLFKVAVINMCIDPEETLEESFDDLDKAFGEGDVKARREDGLVVKSVLDPPHQVLHVLGGAALDGLLDFVSISPEVLVALTSRHGGAALGRAELAHASIEQVDLIEEVDGVDGEPLVQILRLWQLDGSLEVSAAERGLCVLVELMALASLGVALLGFERLALASKIPEHVYDFGHLRCFVGDCVFLPLGFGLLV